MFVAQKMKIGKPLKASALAGSLLLVSAMTSFAADAPGWKKTGDIPVTVTLTDVLPEGAAGGTIYVSIQTREDYQSMKGFGGIIQKAELGEMTAKFTVDEPGEYSVSVWHDRDDDGRFSMDASYNVLDSWGASGTPPKGKAPTFDDVKMTVPSMGTSVTIDMINPVTPS
ncbi:MAG: DUF2141 domain-containing protein [Litorimonas sp.]